MFRSLPELAQRYFDRAIAPGTPLHRVVRLEMEGTFVLNGAEVRFYAARGIEPMRITLDAEGNPAELVALRWTDANPERVHRLQPFGGRILETGGFQGFTIPTRVELGNLFGTPDYAPFFFATVTAAEYRAGDLPRLGRRKASPRRFRH